MCGTSTRATSNFDARPYPSSGPGARLHRSRKAQFDSEIPISHALPAQNTESGSFVACSSHWAILSYQPRENTHERLRIQGCSPYDTLPDSEGYSDGHVAFSAVNRLDRLTSGIMIIPLNTTLAKTLLDEFARGTVQKEYVARCLGKFPS